MLVDPLVEPQAELLVERQVELQVAVGKVDKIEDILAVGNLVEGMFAEGILAVEDMRCNHLCFDTFLFIFLLFISSFYCVF